MTIGGGAVVGLSHTQSGSVCSVRVKVEFLNSHMTAFNMFIVQGDV